MRLGRKRISCQIVHEKNRLTGFQKIGWKAHRQFLRRDFFADFFFGRFQIVFWKRPKFLEVDEMEWRQQKSFFQKFLAKSKNLQFGFKLLLKQTHNWTFFSWPFWSWCQLDTQLQHFNACKNFFLLRFAFQLLKNCAQQFRNNFVRCYDGLPENDAAAFKINFWNNDFHLMEFFYFVAFKSHFFMVEQHHRFNSLLCPSPLSSVITKKNEEKKKLYACVFWGHVISCHY